MEQLIKDIETEGISNVPSSILISFLRKKGLQFHYERGALEAAVNRALPRSTKAEVILAPPEGELVSFIYSFDPWLFSRCSGLVIPDQRSISEETMRCMKVGPWDSWKVLAEEVSCLSSSTERGDEEHLYFYGELKKDNVINSVPYYLHPDFPKGLYKFFSTYPTISYCLLQITTNFPWGVVCDHPNLMKGRKGPLFCAALAQRREVVDWLLDGRDPQDIYERVKNFPPNKYLVEWLSERIPIEQLIDHICVLDHLPLFKKIYDPEEYCMQLNVALMFGSQSILHFFISNHPEKKEEIAHYIIGHLTDRKIQQKMLSVLKNNYGIRRFYGRTDLLRSAIDIRHLELVKDIAKRKDDLAAPINGRSPLIYAYEKSKEIAAYLLPFYDTTPEQILFITAFQGNDKAVEGLLEAHSFEATTLHRALVFAGRVPSWNTSKDLALRLTEALTKKEHPEELSLTIFLR